MKRSEITSSHIKKITFKRAFETIKIYRDQGNFLAAYILTFSIIEDRLRSLYVIWHRATKQTEPKSRDISGSFVQLARKLKVNNIISNDVLSKLQDEAMRRNELIHAAMWNLDTFNDEIVMQSIKLARVIDKIVYNNKK